MIGIRLLAIVLVALGCAAGVGACGGSSPERSSSATPASGIQASQRPRTSADEYPGVFASAKEVCGSVPRERVAANVHSRSTAPTAIARAFASGYKLRLRAHAYRGCLAGLH